MKKAVREKERQVVRFNVVNDEVEFGREEARVVVELLLPEIKLSLAARDPGPGDRPAAA
jgi:hypothetical protein